MLQSSIRLDWPNMLFEEYSRAMMVALLFMNEPGSVLLVGLGGCSLVNFLLDAFPRCSLDIVEIRQEVIDLACRFFLLPRERRHMRIIHAPGQDFVCRRDGPGGYDLILVDAFDEGGPAAALLNKDFIAACRARLNANGIFAMNVWNRPSDNFSGLYASVQEVFEGHTLKLPLGEAYQNAIIFGLSDPRTNLARPEYRRVAERLQQAYGINFPRYLRYLYWQNRGEQ
ncbi:MAG: fused MFS/spermidine synthase [Nitrospirae bacterium]|nr:fused MFS/spermidine synthase [Nitrospirota bacterium]